ncbi:MAG: Do family serine endopeptidase [Pseudobdellovibrionaceae bacterium]|jgi:serine protease Do|nr:Do family serine endopeptidase [Pseudobdellovibrionaceae bacterium]
MFEKFLTVCLISGLIQVCPLNASAQEAPTNETQVKLSFSPIVKEVSPSVVNIYTKRLVTSRTPPLMGDPFFSQFFGGRFSVPQQRLENSLGSGVILDKHGLVITNAHVIEDATEITVALSDGREFPAEIKVKDEASDLGLLQVKVGSELLPAATLQPSDTQEVGDLVIAIGNPFGVGQTVTSGIISALSRSSLSISDLNFFIQTDAAINPGNSGGPLVSTDGGIIGINSAIYSKDGGSLGIGFAIPSEMVASLLAAYEGGQVTQDGKIKRPWLGISAQDVTTDIAESVGLSRPTGALINAVHPSSPAKDAGLKIGDIVSKINGHVVKDSAELRFRMAMVAFGKTAELTIWNKGKERTISFVSIAPPETPARMATQLTGNTPLSGATVLYLSPAVTSELGLKTAPDSGIVIGDILRNSIAQRMVTIGDVILEINGKEIKTMDDLKKSLDRPSNKGWILKILSGGQVRTLMVR